MNFSEKNINEVNLRRKTKNKNYREVYLKITGESACSLRISFILTDIQGYIVNEINIFGCSDELVERVDSLVKDIERFN